MVPSTEVIGEWALMVKGLWCDCQGGLGQVTSKCQGPLSQDACLRRTGGLSGHLDQRAVSALSGAAFCSAVTPPRAETCAVRGTGQTNVPSLCLAECPSPELHGASTALLKT